MMKNPLLVLALMATTAAHADGPRHAVTRHRTENDVRTLRTFETRGGETARLYTHREKTPGHRSTDGVVRMPNGRKATFETDRYRNPVNGNVHRTWSVEGPNGKTRSGRIKRG